MIKNRGEWIQTYTGKQMYPLDPTPEEIDIIDIAHAISLKCRFGGHCKYFYSVAEHSYRMSLLTEDKDFALLCLLHDAAEAYVADVPRPLKRMMPEFREMEKKVSAAIYEKFGVKSHLYDEMVKLDNVMLATEKRDLMHKGSVEWASLPTPLDGVIRPVSAQVAEEQFTERFYELCPHQFIGVFK